MRSNVLQNHRNDKKIDIFFQKYNSKHVFCLYETSTSSPSRQL